MEKRALLSVSNRAGIADIAKALHEAGYAILATSGTGKELNQSGIPWSSVESYTGLAELFDGRVKTLHPKIHGGILARRDIAAHVQQMEMEEIAPIDVVVVNLYPFLAHLKSDTARDLTAMTELIDVGGPTIIRAAAKNHRFVLPLSDPSDYSEAISLINERKDGKDPFPDEFRRRMAAKAFAALSEYDGAIAEYLGRVGSKNTDTQIFPERCSIAMEKASELRYGENPHQRAAMYQVSSSTVPLLQGPSWRQLGGKALSYNNMLDFDAGVRLLRDLPSGETVAAILKHLNPCGLALGATASEAIQRAKQCDPRSHFGGIVVVNCVIDAEAAEEIRGDFAEIVIAPDYSPEGLQILQTSRNLRIMAVGEESLRGFEARTVAGALLIQEPDVKRAGVTDATLASPRAPSDDELRDLELAWRLVGHVKSNAVVIVRDGMLLGVGAGQMSRIDSIELAVGKAKLHGHLLHGAVAASDAFFPFADSIEALAAEGITCVVAPAGSRRDDEVKNAAARGHISLLFTSQRHFKH